MRTSFFPKFKHFCSPVRMFSKSWICIFIRRSSVKISKSMCILREMGRYPVQNDTDLISMQIIDHPCEIFRCSIPGCRCIITSHLIPQEPSNGAPRPHQLHMCITHFFNIFGNCSGKLSICIETFIFPVPDGASRNQYVPHRQTSAYAYDSRSFCGSSILYPSILYSRYL